MVDDYFGTRVPDPYRWLEDLDSTDTAAWIAAQNKVTFAYLESLPQREAIRKRLTELWDYRRTGLPVLEAGQLWFSQNTGLQRQAPVYRQAGFDAKPALVIDPNLLSPDGSVAMAQWSPSPDGRRLAYSSAAGGSDIEDIHVRDLATGKDLADVVLHVKFSNISWTRDSKGFFYSRFKGTESSADFAATVAFHQVWYHSIRGGKPDRLIFERPENRQRGTVTATLSDDGRWLYVTALSGSTGNRLWIGRPRRACRIPTSAPGRSPWQPRRTPSIRRSASSAGPRTCTRTFGAPKGRIVAAKAGESDRSKWRTVVRGGKGPDRGARSAQAARCSSATASRSSTSWTYRAAFARSASTAPQRQRCHCLSRARSLHCLHAMTATTST